MYLFIYFPNFSLFLSGLVLHYLASVYGFTLEYFRIDFELADVGALLYVGESNFAEFKQNFPMGTQKSIV